MLAARPIHARPAAVRPAALRRADPPCGPPSTRSPRAGLASRCGCSTHASGATTRCRNMQPKARPGSTCAPASRRPLTLAPGQAELLPTGHRDSPRGPRARRRAAAALGARPQARDRARQPRRADRLRLPGAGHGLVLESRRSSLSRSHRANASRRWSIVPVVQVALDVVEAFTDSARGAGGFGSSGTS